MRTLKTYYIVFALLSLTFFNCLSDDNDPTTPQDPCLNSRVIGLQTSTLPYLNQTQGLSGINMNGLYSATLSSPPFQSQNMAAIRPSNNSTYNPLVERYSFCHVEGNEIYNLDLTNGITQVPLTLTAKYGGLIYVNDLNTYYMVEVENTNNNLPPPNTQVSNKLRLVEVDVDTGVITPINVSNDSPGYILDRVTATTNAGTSFYNTAVSTATNGFDKIYILASVYLIEVNLISNTTQVININTGNISGANDPFNIGDFDYRYFGIEYDFNTDELIYTRKGGYIFGNYSLEVVRTTPGSLNTFSVLQDVSADMPDFIEEFYSTVIDCRNNFYVIGIFNSPNPIIETRFCGVKLSTGNVQTSTINNVYVFGLESTFQD